MIRVLLVEDSVVQREILRRILNVDGTFTIAGEARNGREGVRLTEELRPDVVLMDIHMPDMNGVEATREIMKRCPVPIVIASATLKKHDLDMGLEALNAGAVTVMAKPEGAMLLNLDKISIKLRDELRSAAKVKWKPVSPNVGMTPSVARSARPQAPETDIIGICTSTGGPPLLIEILTPLPRPFVIPILLVQHITQGFEETFARWLTGRTGQNVGMAVSGQRLAPGIWMAPTGRHIQLASQRTLELPEGKPAEIHCPSGNPLFASLGRHFGARAAGFLLTGMGNDGAAGLLELKQAGGTTIIQDEASSAIWGMPKAGKELEAAKYEMNPREITELMSDMNRAVGN